jgi:hypothetical protein
MARWQTGIPSLIATLLLTACGVVPPSGSDMTIQRTYGYGLRRPLAESGDTGVVPGRIGEPAAPVQQVPWQQPTGPVIPQQGPGMPPQGPMGPTVPPSAGSPTQGPPPGPMGPNIPPGTETPPQGPPVGPGIPPIGTPGASSLEACVQKYMDGIRWFKAPTEQELAGMRESARRQCLSGATGRSDDRIPL